MARKTYRLRIRAASVRTLPDGRGNPWNPSLKPVDYRSPLMANRIYFLHCQVPARARVRKMVSSSVAGPLLDRNMDDSKTRPEGQPVPKKPGGAGVGTPFAGENSGSGVPIPSQGELPPPDLS